MTNGPQNQAGTPTEGIGRTAGSGAPDLDGPPGAPPEDGPSQWSLDPGATQQDRDAHWYRHVYRGDAVRQLSMRAVLMGSVIGSFMSISALYTILKIGWSFGIAMTACIVSFITWKGLRKLSGGAISEMTILENNCMQSTAAAAGYSTGSTISTAVAAMLLITGAHFHWTVLVPFVLLSGLLGVVWAIPMKRHMIDVEQLRFPSGVAVAQTLRSLHGAGMDAGRRSLMLAVGLFAGACLGVLKAPAGVLHWLDRSSAGLRPPSLLRFETVWASQVAADKARALIGFGFEPSLLLIGAGMLTGLRVSLSMLAGSILLYFFVGPDLIAMDESALAQSPSHVRHIELVGGGTVYHMLRWALWGGCSLMVTASLMSLVLQWPALVRSFRIRWSKEVSQDVWLLEQRRRAEVPALWFWLALPPLTIGIMILQNLAFGTPWLLGALAVGLSFVVAVVCCRVTGETDTTPVGPMAKVTQALYAVLPGAAGNQMVNLMTAGVTSNAGIASADLLTDLKTGYLLGAKPRHQFLAQVFGVLVGTVVSVAGWYLLIPSKEVLETYPAPATQAWKVFAEAVTKGLSSVPDTAQAAVVTGAVLGIILPAFERLFPRARPYIPSALGLGLSWVIPFSSSLSFAIGATLLWVWARLNRRSADNLGTTLAAGFIAGESMLAALLAILATLALTFPWLAGAPPLR